MATRYFEACESAERFIQNYQDLKLNTEVPYQKRKSLHDSMLNVINIANQKKSVYEKLLPQANKDLSKFVLVIDKYKK